MSCEIASAVVSVLPIVLLFLCVSVLKNNWGDGN